MVPSDSPHTYGQPVAAGTGISVSSAGSYTLVVKNGNGCSSPVSDAVTFTAAFATTLSQGTTTSLTTTIDVPVSTDLLNLFQGSR